jgi:hypothetical protein
MVINKPVNEFFSFSSLISIVFLSLITGKRAEDLRQTVRIKLDARLNRSATMNAFCHIGRRKSRLAAAFKFIYSQPG